MACHAFLLMGSLKRYVGSNSCSMYSPSAADVAYTGRLNCRSVRSDELVTNRLQVK